MFEWWNSLSVFAQVMACIAIPSTVILLVQTVLMLIGIGSESAEIGDADADIDADIGDVDGDVDLDVDANADGVFGEDVFEADTDPTGLDGLRIFSVRGIIAFLVVFGWVGIVLDEAGLSLVPNLLISVVCGFAVMVLVALLMRAVWKLQSSGNIDTRNALGVSGTVYLTIPAGRNGSGKVNVTVQGAYIECDAVTDEQEAIPTGKEIVVIGRSGQNTLVVKTK